MARPGSNAGWVLTAAALLWAAPAAGRPALDEDPLLAHSLEVETADRIKVQILDPILGPGRAFAFVELSLDVRREREVRGKRGYGLARRFAEKWAGPPKGVEEDLFKGFGIEPAEFHSPKPRVGPSGRLQASTGTALSPEAREKPSSGSQRMQESFQETSIEEQRSSSKLRFNAFQVLVVHDSAVPPARIKLVRETMLKAFGRDLRRDAVGFHSVDFFHP